MNLEVTQMLYEIQESEKHDNAGYSLFRSITRSINIRHGRCFGSFISQTITYSKGAFS